MIRQKQDNFKHTHYTNIGSSWTLKIFIKQSTDNPCLITKYLPPFEPMNAPNELSRRTDNVTPGPNLKILKTPTTVQRTI